MITDLHRLLPQQAMVVSLAHQTSSLAQATLANLIDTSFPLPLRLKGFSRKRYVAHMIFPM